MSKKSTKSIQTLLDSAVSDLFKEYAQNNLQESDLAITLINLTGTETEQAAFRGDEPIYPASLIKLFYLVAAHRWLNEKKIKDSEELQRALRDMIVESSNDATHYVVDLLTDTTSGPELPAAQMADWSKKRNAINEYFVSCGYKNINLNQKTWGDGPFGRERVFVGKEYENRNKLTTNAVAKLLSDIVTGKAITSVRSQQMHKLIERDFAKVSEDPDDQATKFIGAVLPSGAKLWSKAGWTSTARHDAAYIELPTGVRIVLVIFTMNHAKEYGIIHSAARRIVEGLGSTNA